MEKDVKPMGNVEEARRHDQKPDSNPPPGSRRGGKPEDEEQVQKEAKVRPEREATFKDFIRIFSYAVGWDFALMTAAALAACGAGITLPLMNVVFGKLVGNFTDYFKPCVPGNCPSQSQFESDLNRQSLYIFVLFLARFALGYVNKFCFRMIGIRMSSAIRLHYLRSLFGQSIHVLDSMPAGAAAGTITSTANTLQLGISEKMGTFLEFLATIIAALVIAFTYSWSLTLVTASVVLFILVVVSILLPFIVKGQTRYTKAETKGNAVASEAFAAIRMVTACGAESRVAERFAYWTREARKHGNFMTPPLAAQFALIFFGLYSSFGLAFWYGSKSYVEGRIDNVGTIVIVLMSVMLMVISLERLSTPLLAASKSMVAAADFFAVIDAPKPETGSRTLDAATDDIIFSDVTFAYPARPHVKVLDNLNLRIEAGKVNAIVGPSGSGKSTIVGLIERWYTLHDQAVIAKAIEKDKKDKKNKKKKEASGSSEDSDDEDANAVVEETGPPVDLSGTITTADINLDEVEIKWWRSKIGLVQQEPFLFNASIYENVAYGLVGTELWNEPEEKKQELVREACEEAFATEFITRMPQGYETEVGDAGTKLSGGQRQRIAIARAIIKKPQILILDEATSAIDVRGEKIVQQALDRAALGRTTVTIAHRLSTIKKADKIIVLKGGRKVEEGTHESLLEKDKGVYSGLVRAQQLTMGDESEEPEEPDLEQALSHKKSAAAGSVAGEAEEAGKVTGANLLTSFIRLLYEQKRLFPYYGISIIGSMFAGAAVPVQAYLFAQVVNVFQILDRQEFMDRASFWGLMWVVMAIGTGMAYFVTFFASSYVAHAICAVYRQEYMQSILHQPIKFFDGEAHGTVAARIAGDPKQLEELLGPNMAMVYNAVFTIIGSLAIAFSFGWKLALVATCVTIPLGLLSGYYRVKYELQFDKMYAAVFAESSKWAAESIGAFRTVSSLTLEDVITNRYQGLLRGHVVAAYKKARWQSIVIALSDSISLACQALIFWYGGRLLASREYEPLNFFICYMAVIQGAESAGQGLSFGPNAAQASSAASRILGIRSTRLEEAPPSKDDQPDTEGGVKLELEGVHFKYPSRDVSVFRGLSMTIEAGSYVALVGASGSGKTSIVALLERFYDPQQGVIRANGRDISEMNVYEYRKLLSLVSQEAALFAGTLRENILLGVDAEDVSEAQLEQVCRDANIYDFISSLPEGFNTSIGSKGVSLSGGQKQRIAIARALIRRPKILLLDEATSSLDSESEKLIQVTFEKVAAARTNTTIAVAHRLSTIQNADVIWVLGEGQVLEKGSHAELLRKRGVYWSMCQSQALDR